MAPVPGPSSPDTENPRLRLGRRGEEAAASFLEGRGHRILARRFRTRQGEIDLVTQSGDHIYFVEVKTRRALGGPPPFGDGFEAVDSRKQKRIVGLGRIFIERHRLHGLVPHFAVIAVEQHSDGAELHFLPDAFHAS